MTIASRNQISHYHEAKSNLQSLVKQTCQVGLGFAVMLLVTAGRPSVFGLSVTVGLGIAFVTWGEVKRLDSSNFSINKETQRENIKTYYEPMFQSQTIYHPRIFQSQLYDKDYKEKKRKENILDEEFLDPLVLLDQIIRHLLLLEYWAEERDYRANHWKSEIYNFRLQLQRRRTKTLYNHLTLKLDSIYSDSLGFVKIKTDQKINFPSECPYKLEQLLDINWLPEF